jgi:hypothetical protein
MISSYFIQKRFFSYLGGTASNDRVINPLNAELNPICHLLAILGAHRILHVSRIRVNDEEIERL